MLKKLEGEPGKQEVTFEESALKTIASNTMVERIKEFLPEVARANRAFGKSNSQTSSSLMSLNMIDAGPYRFLRQILAQIEKKRLALKEAGYKHALAEIRLQEASNRIREIALSERPELVAERDRLFLRVKKIRCDLSDSRIYIDATVKEIGAFMERYRQVVESHGIPENWSERDFEAAEIKHHITAIFRLALRDRMGRSTNKGTMEYMEQFGIEPMVAYDACDRFLMHLGKSMGGDNDRCFISIESRYAFYDQMFEVFKNEYKKALAWIGLKSPTFGDWMEEGGEEQDDDAVREAQG